MAINMTWRNIFMMVALVTTLFSALIGGTAAMVQWRLDAVQRQLAERMTLYIREVERIEKRLDILEEHDRR